MRKVCMSTGWHDCGSNDQAADGVSCAYLTDNEEVVCLPNNFGPCDHKNHQIDGWTTLIKDKSQKVVCYHNDFKSFGGPQCTCVHDGRGVDGRTYIKLINRPFFEIASGAPWDSTAVVIMDMWDNHPCRGTRERAKQLAPWIEDFTAELRRRGALIIHSVSTSLTPGYGWVLRGRYDPIPNPISTNSRLPRPTPVESDARRKAVLARFPNGVRDGTTAQLYSQIGIPIDPNPTAAEYWERTRSYYNVDGEDNLGNADDFDEIVPFDCDLDVDQGQQPTGQTPLIVIQAGDAIVGDGLDGTDRGDAFKEVMALTADRPYIVFCGINTNQCILRRTNGMRTMYKAGKSLWIVRDLTDAYCGTKGFLPWKGGHNQGTDETVDWIRDNLNALDDTSNKVMGGTRHWFIGDLRASSEKAYYIINMKDGWCISGLHNGGDYALYYRPEGSSYNLWRLVPTSNNTWKVVNVDQPSKVLACKDNNDGFCFMLDTDGPEGHWSIAEFANGLEIGVPFQLKSVKNAVFAAVGPDSPGNGPGANTYYQQPEERLNSWWALVQPS